MGEHVLKDGKEQGRYIAAKWMTEDATYVKRVPGAESNGYCKNTAEDNK